MGLHACATRSFRVTKQASGPPSERNNRKTVPFLSANRQGTGITSVDPAPPHVVLNTVSSQIYAFDIGDTPMRPATDISGLPLIDD